MDSGAHTGRTVRTATKTKSKEDTDDTDVQFEIFRSTKCTLQGKLTLCYSILKPINVGR